MKRKALFNAYFCGIFTSSYKRDERLQESMVMKEEEYNREMLRLGFAKACALNAMPQVQGIFSYKQS